MTADHQPLQPLPAPPRPLSPRARRRSWAEAPVRVWTVLTALVAISLIALAIQNIYDHVVDRNIIFHGVPVVARIIDVAGYENARKTVATHGATEDRTVHLSYQDSNGKAVDSPPRVLQTERYEGRRPGEMIEVRYDPNRPEIWTDRLEPQPLIARMAIVWMLCPALAVAVGMLFFRRQQTLRIWRDGSEIIGTVLDLRQSAIAPRSRMVRFTFNDHAERRIFSTLFPVQAGLLQKGDELLLLTPTHHKKRAIVAELYE